MAQKLNKVICPYCKAEYLPAEIYTRKNFLGNPSYIEKDHVTGKILSFAGRDMDLQDTYICDFCDKPFRVQAKITFFTQENSTFDFNSDYSTKMVRKKIFLAEE